MRADYPKASGLALERAAFALAHQAALGRRGEEIDSFIPADDAVAKEIIIRAVAVPGSTTGSGWAADLAQQSFGQYLADLAPYSGGARLIAQAQPAVANNPENPTTYPTRAGASALTFVGEDAPIPVSNYTFNGATIGPKKKMGVILPWSRELSKRSDAVNIFSQMLREDLAAGIDTAFFSTSAGTSAAPAGLLYGVTAGTGYGGGDRDAIDNDLTSLSDVVATGGSGNVTFVMAPERLARLRIKAPDLVRALDIAPSAVVPTSRVIAVDAAALLVAVDPEPELEASDEALIHMSSVPLEIVSHTGPTTADPVRSLWQTASMSFRLLYSMDFSKRRSTAAAYLDGASW
ncbi:phage major capsid protein [Bradyrhizobium sp. CB1717]|uniref:phage major capsid protein n=1 Tax=Bradyrhizobium sp. CB1717 TaxID=3039154 RepID=UPI0024B1B6EA|nr:phage major capsid protein [Bradyrhizobium sp. CB1717]WFU28351.1 phage major capsid protein [Bradyrhizobium sp. CB1717]